MFIGFIEKFFFSNLRKDPFDPQHFGFLDPEPDPQK